VLYNFKTVEDNQQYVVDTERLTWARASSILSAPSVTAVESKIARFVAAEEGRLIPLGGGRFAFEGRSPFDKDGKPQLAIAIIVHVPVTDPADGKVALVCLIQTNVNIKDGAHTEIQKFVVENLPALRPPQNPARRAIVMPPITADEQKAAAPSEQASAPIES
jgi:hypothetical protein